MENSAGGRRLLVPLQVPMGGAGGGGASNGGGTTGGGGGAYAVLQFVGYAHSPLPSPNSHSSNQPSSIMWPVAASPVPSPRTPTSGSPIGESSPKPHQGEGGGGGPPPPPPPPQLQQQQQVATTFVQADTSSFKEVVQKLTGATDEKKMPITMPARYAPRSVVAPPEQHQRHNHHHHQEVVGNGGSGAALRPGFDVGPRKPAFKLHERRRNLRSLGINPPAYRQNGIMSPRNSADLLSPSMLDLPSLVLSPALSPVTPLGGDHVFDCPSSAGTSCNEASPTEEEKAIAQKGYYLHPSPRTTTPRDSKPQLLPLFPLSPREGESST